MTYTFEQKIEYDHIIIRTLLDLFAKYEYSYSQAKELLQDTSCWLDAQLVQPAASTERL